jgi:hypothetical protein
VRIQLRQIGPGMVQQCRRMSHMGLVQMMDERDFSAKRAKGQDLSRSWVLGV